MAGAAKERVEQGDDGHPAGDPGYQLITEGRNVRP